jgi:hypothetical protein
MRKGVITFLSKSFFQSFNHKFSYPQHPQNPENIKHQKSGKIENFFHTQTTDIFNLKTLKPKP